jgi:hypothetical protein
MFKSNGCGCCCEASCCCEQSCCCDSCGCGCGDEGDHCGCNGGEDKHEGEDEGDEAPAAPAEAGASIRPVAPRPMADPNAAIGQQREVVRTSFLR